MAAIATTFLLYIGVLTSAGTVLATLVFRTPNMKSVAIRFACLGLVCALLGFLLDGAALTGDASGMTDPAMLGLLWVTPVGTALSFRVIGLALVITGLAFGRLGLWVSAPGAFLALWSFVTVGHIYERDRLWLDALLMIHLTIIALWIGILTPLRRLARDGAASAAAQLGHRFGRLAVFVVPLLILAGLVMSYVLVGSIAALFGTGYGQMLMVKVAVVAGLLGLGALNKVRFVPRLMAGDKQAAKHLSWSIAFEWVAFCVILLTTAVLTSVLSLPS